MEPFASMLILSRNRPTHMSSRRVSRSRCASSSVIRLCGQLEYFKISLWLTYAGQYVHESQQWVTEFVTYESKGAYRGGGRYKCAFVKKVISAKNRAERFTYGNTHL
jgi:hypothetical protein